MRGKVAKRLRRMARQASQGLPEKSLQTKRRSVKRNVKGKSTLVSRDQSINDPSSTRGIYLNMKKNYKDKARRDI